MNAFLNKRMHIYDHETQADLGAYYTPPVLADWIVELALAYNKGSSKAILDPACGDGALLLPISKKLPNPLIAVDINPRVFPKIKEHIPKGHALYTMEADTLSPLEKVTTVNFWEKVFKTKKVGLVVSNPPWGAKVRQSPEELLLNGITLATGQYDSYELFMEVMIKAAPRYTYLIFIIPDSIFLPEHKKLRQLILKKTKMHILCRLGEGFFKNVYRGTCVMVLEKDSNNYDHVVECMRLNNKWKKRVLGKQASLGAAFRELSHKISQHRFASNKENLFDIDILESDQTIKKIEALEKLDIDFYFRTGRGVEVSKTGKVTLCDNCGRAHPIPKKKDTLCCTCGHTYNVSSRNITSVITNENIQDSVPIIVGEDVDRYYCSIPQRYLIINVKGIQYKKQEDYKRKKLLVRKTGIGIKSAIDTSGAFTNQVVFHYIAKEGKRIPNFITEYLNGVLSSRVLLAYYLKKYGESEWRSHPYITQKIISQLPIPEISNNERNYELAKKIAKKVHKIYTEDSKDMKKLDMDIEKLIFELYNLTDDDKQWIIDTLMNSQQLEPIRSLILPDNELRNI